jgi:hypothetical protein
MQVKPSIFVKGLATYIPGAKKYFCSSSGGTVSSRYCYSVWMRHLVRAHEAGLDTRLQKIAELGPGDSLGIGLCAVLCGVKEYYAFDIKVHANSERNRKIFDELVMMLKRREAIPDEAEFPNISPSLGEHSFPHHILTDEILRNSLHPERLGAIHKTLNDNRSSNIGHIAYVAPWQGVSLYESGGALDMVFSQAVMEHVAQVDSTYAAFYKWLCPGGLMSHTIDYKSHGYTSDWNGHWAISEKLWKIVKGNRPYLINRLPHSAHIEAIKKAGFQIVGEVKRNSAPLPRQKLSEKFRTLSDDDLRTSGAFIQAMKPLPYQKTGI